MILGTACYLRHDGKTLMLLRDKKSDDIMHGFYSVPGGKINEGESPEEGIFREYLEETGLSIINPLLRGYVTIINSGLENWGLFIYTAASFKGQLKECNEGTLEWVATSEVPQLNIRPSDRMFLPYIDGCGFFTGKITNRDGHSPKSEFSIYR